VSIFSVLQDQVDNLNTTKSAVRLTYSNRFSGAMSGSKITT
jgi:hypothetical protein